MGFLFVVEPYHHFVVKVLDNRGSQKYSLSTGKYTIFFKYYFPEKTRVNVYTSASFARINKETSFLHNDYMAVLVQKRLINYLYFILTGEATVQIPQGYIVIYGCQGYVNVFDSSVYDNIYMHENNYMKLNSNINMDGHKIINLALPTENDDSSNKYYVDKSINDEITKMHVVMPVINENVFKYLMDNNESHSEQNIIINGLHNFQNSPHLYSWNK